MNVIPILRMAGLVCLSLLYGSSGFASNASDQCLFQEAYAKYLKAASAFNNERILDNSLRGVLREYIPDDKIDLFYPTIRAYVDAERKHPTHNFTRSTIFILLEVGRFLEVFYNSSATPEQLNIFLKEIQRISAPIVTSSSALTPIRLSLLGVKSKDPEINKILEKGAEKNILIWSVDLESWAFAGFKNALESLKLQQIAIEQSQNPSLELLQHALPLMEMDATYLSTDGPYVGRSGIFLPRFRYLFPPQSIVMHEYVHAFQDMFWNFEILLSLFQRDIQPSLTHFRTIDWRLYPDLFDKLKIRRIMFARDMHDAAYSRHILELIGKWHPTDETFFFEFAIYLREMHAHSVDRALTREIYPHLAHSSPVNIHEDLELIYSQNLGMIGPVLFRYINAHQAQQYIQHLQNNPR